MITCDGTLTLFIFCENISLYERAPLNSRLSHNLLIATRLKFQYIKSSVLNN